MVDSCRTLRDLPGRPGAVLRDGMVGTYNSPDQRRGRHDLRRLLEARSSWTRPSCCGSPDEHRPAGVGAAALRRHHDLLAAAPLGCGPGQEGRRRRPRRPRPHGRQARPRDGRRGRAVHDVGWTRWRTPSASAPTRSFVSTDPEQMAAWTATRFDLILDTVSAPHDLDALLNLLRRDGTLVLVGAPASPHRVAERVRPADASPQALAGSLIGGIPETQEMLDFCAEHGIAADIEVIPHGLDQRGLRADAEERREVPLRDRPRDTRVGEPPSRLFFVSHLAAPSTMPYCLNKIAVCMA